MYTYPPFVKLHIKILLRLQNNFFEQCLKREMQRFKTKSIAGKRTQAYMKKCDSQVEPFFLTHLQCIYDCAELFSILYPNLFCFLPLYLTQRV